MSPEPRLVFANIYQTGGSDWTMHPHRRLEEIWEAWSGDAAAGVSLLHSTRKRLLTFTALLTFAVALVWVGLTGLTLISARPLMALACAIVPFMFLPFPYLVLKTRFNFEAVALGYLVTLYLVVTLTAAMFGGAVSTTSFFLVLVPLLATLLMGIRAGVLWVLVVALSYAALHALRGYLPTPAFELRGAWPNDWVAISEVSLWNALMMTLLSLAACFSVANFRAVVSKASVLLVDATDKTRDALNARQVAETVSRLRAEFIANVSHELRTPLNAIIGYSELLIETADERGDEIVAQDNRRILEAAVRLGGMVNDIMKLSAIDAGRVRAESDELDVAALVRDAVAAQSASAVAKNNRIEIGCDDFGATHRLDGAKLDSCLRTLIAHSIAFTEGGLISVRVQEVLQDGGRWIRFDVEDCGADLDETAIQHLFEPFVHTTEDKIARFDGANLSLALCRRLVRVMGGDLTAAPRRGGGAHFTLTARVDGPEELAA